MNFSANPPKTDIHDNIRKKQFAHVIQQVSFVFTILPQHLIALLSSSRTIYTMISTLCALMPIIRFSFGDFSIFRCFFLLHDFPPSTLKCCCFSSTSIQLNNFFSQQTKQNKGKNLKRKKQPCTIP